MTVVRDLAPRPDRPLGTMTRILSFTDSLLGDSTPQPDPYPHGRLMVSDSGTEIAIERADPRILLADEYLAKIRDDEGVGGRSRNGTLGLSLRRPILVAPWTCWTGYVLHVQAIDRTLIYRIGEYRALPNCWEAAWPD